MAIQLALVFVSSAVLAEVPVKVDVAGGGDFTEIQAAIDWVGDGATILVAPGQYVVAEPVTLKGKKITVKSEDGPEKTTIRMSDAPRDPARASVVIFESGETAESLLEGFTLTGGKGTRQGDPQSSYAGGGVLCLKGAAPTLSDCLIVNNAAQGPDGMGGGVYCDSLGMGLPASLTLTCCRISGNSAKWMGGIDLMFQSSTLTDCTVSNNSGGGISIGEMGAPETVLRNCTISGNSGVGVNVGDSSRTVLEGCTISENTGPGVDCGDCSPTLRNCRISGNRDVGLNCDDSGTHVVNCVISGNLGAGVLCDESNPRLTNCTITGNSGGGVRSPGEDSSPILLNCIVWGNGGDAIWFDPDSTTTASYSCIESAEVSLGEGNIRGDPLFVHTGRWNDGGTDSDPADDVWVEGDYHLQAGSPAIDAGTAQGAPTMDMEGHTRPCGSGVDMGACESGNCSASEAPFRRGDVTGEGSFDISDPINLLGYLFLGTAAPPCLDAGDADDSGKLEITDPIHSLSHLFLGGPQPKSPFPGCGVDPSLDALPCATYGGCG